jgi:hypothetical protein
VSSDQVIRGLVWLGVAWRLWLLAASKAPTWATRRTYAKPWRPLRLLEMRAVQPGHSVHFSRRGRQIGPRRPPGPEHPPAGDRTGQALLAAGPGRDASPGAGSHPAPARRAGIVDHGRDLGPCDVLDVRLRAADTIVFPDFSPFRCAWRAIRRSRERAGFWKTAAYRSPSQPPAAPAGDRRTRRRRRHLRPASPARGQAIRREDNLRHALPAPTAWGRSW